MANELSKLTKNQAVEMASRMKNRAKSIRANAEKLTERLAHAGIATIAAGGVGYWMGVAESDYQDMLQKDFGGDEKAFEASDKADPRHWFGIPKDLVVGLAAGGIAYTNLLGKKVSTFVEPAAVGALAGWAYSMGMDRGISADDEEEAA